MNNNQSLKEKDSVALFLKNENVFLKRKVKSLKKDLSKFVKGKRNLNALLGIQKSSYDKGGVGFVYGNHDKFQRNLFVKVTQNSTPSLKCNFCGKNGHLSQSCFYKNSHAYDSHGWVSKRQPPKKQDTNPKGPKMIWVPKKR